MLLIFASFFSASSALSQNLNVDALPPGIDRSEYCEMCNLLNEHVYSKSIEPNFDIVKTLENACTKDRMKLGTWNSQHLLESCESFVAGHLEEIKAADVTEHLKNHSTLYKYLCVELSQSCIGVQKEENKFKPGDVSKEDLSHENLAKMLNVPKEKIRTIRRTKQPAPKKPMRHDEL